MIRIVENIDSLAKYREAELLSPRWFKDACDTWHLTDEEFRGFCNNCYRFYEINDNALIYCEKTSPESVNIHLGILRGARIDIGNLLIIRDDLFKEFEMIFGFVESHNRMVKRICEEVGLYFYGLTMLHGSSHGRPIEWHCYSANREYIANQVKSLVN